MPGIRSTDGSRHGRAHARTWGARTQGEGHADDMMTMLAGMTWSFWLLVIVILFVVGGLLGLLAALLVEPSVWRLMEKTFLRFWARTKNCFFSRVGRKSK